MSVDEIEVGVIVEADEHGTSMELRPVLSHLPAERSIEELVERSEKIQQAMSKVMVRDVHYGVIPGTDKPTLLQPGAQKLCQLFMLDPEFPDVTDRYEEVDVDGILLRHRDVDVRCVLRHIPTGATVAEGRGSCSTRESRYAWRNSKRTCPACGNATIIKGKAEYGGGWLCFKKQGGCGVKFQSGDPQIETQAAGRTANLEIADQYNTVLKMACKRAFVAATLHATSASDTFTQDMEDSTPAPSSAPASPPQAPPPAPAPPPPPVPEVPEEDKPSKEQHAKCAMLLKELQQEAPDQEGLPTWLEQMREFCKAEFGKASRARLTSTEMARLIDRFEQQLEAEKLPL